MCKSDSTDMSMTSEISFSWGDIKIPHSRLTKACWRNVGNLFVICMKQVTKDHLYHLFGVLDFYVIYR